MKAYDALTAEEKKKKEEAHKSELAEYDKKIKDAKDKIVAAAVAASSIPGGNAGTDPNSVDKVVNAVTHITDQVNDVNDLFYICLDVVQTLPANGVTVPPELAATCALVFTEAKGKVIKGNPGANTQGGAGGSGTSQ
ncbi:hypothetical protein [Stutzerimonas stutzeri]|uniref:hypothetical protein n=1 Tax=Stutzerimonas stutzeri TaxID=316 RepID=UPI003DA093FB